MSKGYHIVIQRDEAKTTTLFWPHSMKDGCQTTTKKYNKISEEDNFTGQSYTDMFNQFEVCTIPTYVLAMVEKEMQPRPCDASRRIIVKFAALAPYMGYLKQFIPGNPRPHIEADAMFQGADDGDSSEEEGPSMGGSSTPRRGRNVPGTCRICTILAGKSEPRVGCAASLQSAKEQKIPKVGCPFRIGKKATVDKMLESFSEIARGYYKDATEGAIAEAMEQYNQNYENSKKQ